MPDSGWYITQATAPEGTFAAGERCWAIMLGGSWVQGFPLTPMGMLNAFTWGPLNGKGLLAWRKIDA